MSGYELIYASLLLGAFVLCAGGYGILYTLAQVQQASRWLQGARACYAVQWLVTLALITTAPLAIGWKLLIVGSCLATLYVPRVTWKYLELIHK